MKSRAVERLLRETSSALLDRDMDQPVVQEIRQTLTKSESGLPIEVADLHVWRVGRHRFACVIRLATTAPTLTAQGVREHLAHFPALVHATVEIDYSAAP